MGKARKETKSIPPHRVELGKAINRARRSKKLTQQDLATEVHKSVATISKIEHGLQAVDIDLLILIAGVLELSPATLLVETQLKTVRKGSSQHQVLKAMSKIVSMID